LGEDFVGYASVITDPVSSRVMELIVNWDLATGQLLPSPSPERIRELIARAEEILRKKKEAKGEGDAPDDRE
jgi:hypothetical protein